MSEDPVVAGVPTRLVHAGSGPPVLLLHGLGASSYSWRLVLPALSRRFSVWAPDWPGFGRSGKPRSFDYSFRGFSRWLLALLDALGLDRAALVGNSLGGVVGLMTALERPERISRLSLLGAPVYLVDRPRLLWPLRWPVVGPLYSRLIGPTVVRVIARTAFHDPACVTEELVAEYASAVRSSDGRHALVSFLRNAIPDDAEAWMARYPTLRVPTLYIRGSSDGVVDAQSAQRFSREAPGVRLVAIERCGHAPQEERPDEVISALESFL